MAVYSLRKCDYCGIQFQPLSSRHKTCSAGCRFKSIAQQFNDPNGCWEWPKSRNVDTGYGQFNLQQKPKLVTISAHRFSYELFVGPITKGFFACHSCDNKGCFNPAHLFLGSPMDNMQDMIGKGRWKSRGPARSKLKTEALAKR